MPRYPTVRVSRRISTDQIAVTVAPSLLLSRAEALRVADDIYELLSPEGASDAGSTGVDRVQPTRVVAGPAADAVGQPEDGGTSGAAVAVEKAAVARYRWSVHGMQDEAGVPISFTPADRWVRAADHDAALRAKDAQIAEWDDKNSALTEANAVLRGQLTAAHQLFAQLEQENEELATRIGSRGDLPQRASGDK